MGTAKKADKDFGFNFSPQVGVATGLLSGLSDWIKQKKAAEVQAMQQEGMMERALAPVKYQEQARTRRFETEQAGLMQRWFVEQNTARQEFAAEHEARLAGLDLQLKNLENTLTLGREQITSEETIAQMQADLANLRTEITEWGAMQREQIQSETSIATQQMSDLAALERTQITEAGETGRAGTWAQKTTEYVRQDKEALNRLKFEKTFKMSDEEARLMASLERAADVYLGIALQRADDPDNVELQTQYGKALDEYENLRKQAHGMGLPVSTISPSKFTPGRERALFQDIKWWGRTKPTVEPRSVELSPKATTFMNNLRSQRDPLWSLEENRGTAETQYGLSVEELDEIARRLGKK